MSNYNGTTTVTDIMNKKSSLSKTFIVTILMISATVSNGQNFILFNYIGSSNRPIGTLVITDSISIKNYEEFGQEKLVPLPDFVKLEQKEFNIFQENIVQDGLGDRCHIKLEDYYYVVIIYSNNKKIKTFYLSG